MFNYKLQMTGLAFMFSLATFAVSAQKVREPKPMSAEWAMLYQPFRIAGNLYYVGTYDLACYLITTPAGHILINTGLAASEALIKNNIKSLGFQFTDIKILLTTQAHFDHMGAMAAIKKATGATMMVNEKDAAVLQDGGSSDYALGGNGTTYKSIKPERLLRDGDTISLGNMQLFMLHHPGHTKGSCSYLFTVKDEQQSYRVLIANMPTIVTEKPFAAVTSYTAIAGDYAYTLQAMQTITFDIWLASHASQFKLHDKHKPGAAYNPAAFKDQQGYTAALSELQKKYEEKMQQQATIQ